MNLVVMLLSLPPASDVNRFPTESDCTSELRCCEQHLVRLEWLARIRGWDGGMWDASQRETEDRMEYWSLVLQCHGWGGKGENLRRVYLWKLKEFIGPLRYLEGWKPPPTPYLHKEPWVEWEQRMPQLWMPGTNNANGSG